MPDEAALGSSAGPTGAPGGTPAGEGRWHVGFRIAWWTFSSGVLALFLSTGQAPWSTGAKVRVCIAWSVAGVGVTTLLTRAWRAWGGASRPRPWRLAALALGVPAGTVLFAIGMAALHWAWAEHEPQRVDGGGLGAMALFIAMHLTLWLSSMLLVAQSQRAMLAERRALSATHEATRAQLASLRYQLQPHFVFNALNSISAAVDEEPSRAQRMLVDLAALLRESLRVHPEEGSLGQELERVRLYLTMELARFEEHLQVQLDLDPPLQQVPCLPLLLQPLVENAIKHGMAQGRRPLLVRLWAERLGSSVRVVLENQGALSPSWAPGTGLTNVRARLRARYGDRHACTLSSEGEWVRAVVSWPSLGEGNE